MSWRRSGHKPFPSSLSPYAPLAAPPSPLARWAPLLSGDPRPASTAVLSRDRETAVDLRGLASCAVTTARRDFETDWLRLVWEADDEKRSGLARIVTETGCHDLLCRTWSSLYRQVPADWATAEEGDPSNIWTPVCTRVSYLWHSTKLSASVQQGVTVL